jgi:hypothetical protein
MCDTLIFASALPAPGLQLGPRLARSELTISVSQEKTSSQTVPLLVYQQYCLDNDYGNTEG